MDNLKPNYIKIFEWLINSFQNSSFGFGLLRDKQIHFSQLIQEIHDHDNFLQYLHNDN